MYNNPSAGSHFLMVFVFMLLAATGANAGNFFGTLSSGGMPLPHASITVCPAESPSRENCYNAVTGSDGSFLITNVPPGRYEVFTPGRMGGEVDGSCFHSER